jgi:hypothetical protein
MSAQDLIASARSATNITDNQYVTIGMPKNTLTPATLTAMAGMAQGGALQISNTTSGIINSLQTNVSSIFSSAGGNASILSAAGVSFSTPSLNVAGDISKVVSNAAAFGVTIGSATQSLMSNVMSASSGLSSLVNKMLPAGNPAAFGKFLAQAQSHITDSIELKKAINFTNTLNISDFGSGVKEMADMADRGLNNVFGSLPSAANAIKATGSMFAGTSTSNFGQSAGIVDALNQNKLGNATGVNKALAAAGVPLNDIGNPVYADTVKKVLGGIKNPAILNTIAKQFNINPAAGLPKIAGFSMPSITGNPLSKLPSVVGDNSIITNASKILGGS